MNSELKPIIKLRHGVETDNNFIFATWLRGLYYGNSFFRQIDKNEFMEFYGRVVDNILRKPGVQIMVACQKEDEDCICGYSLTEELQQYKILHWVFIKPEWRSVGLASDLIPETTNVVTHVVDSMLKVNRKETAKTDRYLANYDIKMKDKKLAFKPFLI